MTLALDISRLGNVGLEHLVVDVDGTLTDNGRLAECAEPRLSRIRRTLCTVPASADTFAFLEELVRELGADTSPVADERDKADPTGRLAPRARR